jgi:hypothetical protein
LRLGDEIVRTMRMMLKRIVRVVGVDGKAEEEDLLRGRTGGLT